MASGLIRKSWIGRISFIGNYEFMAAGQIASVCSSSSATSSLPSIKFSWQLSLVLRTPAWMIIYSI
jgi:hypothetical protein